MTPDDRYVGLHADCLELVAKLRDRIHVLPEGAVDWPNVVVLALLKRHLEDALATAMIGRAK